MKIITQKGVAIPIADKISNKIEEVCQKINFTSSDVKWIISTPHTHPYNLKQKLVHELYSNIFGYYIIENNEIYIYTSIIKDLIYNDITSEITAVIQDYLKPYSNSYIYNDLGANVIICGITYSQVKQKSNTQVFKDKHEENLKMYYRKPLDLSSIINNN